MGGKRDIADIFLAALGGNPGYPVLAVGNCDIYGYKSLSSQKPGRNICAPGSISNVLQTRPSWGIEPGRGYRSVRKGK